LTYQGLRLNETPSLKTESSTPSSCSLSIITIANRETERLDTVNSESHAGTVNPCPLAGLTSSSSLILSLAHK